MKWIFAMLLCSAITLQAESLKLSKTAGSIIRTKNKIQTGPSSRLELELPYFAIARIGSNADLKFSPDAKTLSLKSGALMLSIPKKTPGVKVESGSIITSLAKGAIEMSNVNGKVKVVSLDGKISVSLSTNPSDRQNLRSGDMVDVPAGAAQMPPVTAIKLGLLIKTSILINMGPFPGLRAIKQNATQQSPPGLPFFVTGGFDPDWGGSGGGSLLTTIGPSGTAAMVTRMEQGKPLPPPPVIAPDQIPTQSQVAALDAAGLPVPNVTQADSRRILRGVPGIRDRLRERLRERLRPPVMVQPTPPPAPTPPIATPRPMPTQGLPVPRPTLRPPIAVP